jgi:group I intron endonuclease
MSQKKQPSNMDVFIYCLTDPKTKQIRYVGKTVNVAIRLRDHQRDGKNTHKTAWLKLLKADDLKPEVDILETFFDSNDEDWQDAERWWISYLRSIGCPLTNLDTGGVGGKRHAQETKDKIAMASTGRVKSEAEREKMSQGRKGWKRSAKHLAATVEYWTGRKHKPSTIEKMKAARAGDDEPFRKELCNRLGEYAISLGRGGIAAVSRLLKIHAGTVQQWIRGVRIPTGKNVQIVAALIKGVIAAPVSEAEKVVDVPEAAA